MGCFNSKPKSEETKNPDPTAGEEIESDQAEIPDYLLQESQVEVGPTPEHADNRKDRKQAYGGQEEQTETVKERMKEIEGKKEATIQEGDFHTIEQVEEHVRPKSPDRKRWSQP